MVISKELKELILPNLKMSLPYEKHDDVDKYFTEVYLMEEDIGNVVCLRCTDSDGGEGICFRFLALNGAFYDVDDWEYVKQKGILL